MRQIDDLAEAMELIKTSKGTVKEIAFSGMVFYKPILNVDFEKCEFSCCDFIGEVAATSFRNCSFYKVRFTNKVKGTHFYNSERLDLFFNEAYIENCNFDNLADTERKRGPHHFSFENSVIYGTCFWNIAVSTFDCENNYFNYCDFDNYEIGRFMDDANFFYDCVFRGGVFDIIYGGGGTYTSCKISNNNSPSFLNWFKPTCPTEGSFIGYKKIITFTPEGFKREAIVKLQIPEDAERTRSTFRKCRCDKAIVLSIVGVPKLASMTVLTYALQGRSSSSLTLILRYFSRVKSSITMRLCASHILSNSYEFKISASVSSTP